MTDGWNPATTKFKVGDVVKIHHSRGWTGPIIEWHGPLGPGGAQIYRVQVTTLVPGRDVVDVREDQLELIEAAPTVES